MPICETAGQASAALWAACRCVVKAARFGPISNGSVTPLPRMPASRAFWVTVTASGGLWRYRSCPCRPTDIEKVGANGSLSQSVGVYESEGPLADPGWSYASPRRWTRSASSWSGRA